MSKLILITCMLYLLCPSSWASSIICKDVQTEQSGALNSPLTTKNMGQYACLINQQWHHGTLSTSQIELGALRRMKSFIDNNNLAETYNTFLTIPFDNKESHKDELEADYILARLYSTRPFIKDDKRASELYFKYYVSKILQWLMDPNLCRELSESRTRKAENTIEKESLNNISALCSATEAVLWKEVEKQDDIQLRNILLQRLYYIFDSSKAQEILQQSNILH